MSIIPEGMTIKEYYARDAQRKKRRALAAKFNAKMSGKAVTPDKSTLIAQLDHITSLLVRRRDRLVHAGLCLVCVAKQALGLLDRAPEPIELCYHVLPRGDKMTRWDLRNMIGACRRCNDGERWSRTKASLRARYRAIHAYILGEAVLQELEKLSTETAHYSTADLITMRDERKAQLEGRA